MADDDSYFKVPAARLDYTWGWGDWLADVGDTIDPSGTTVTVPAGLTKVGDPVITETDVTQRVSGGALDNTYRMVCQITTVGGLIDERHIDLTIRSR